MKVYLCGPMAATTPETANGWRLATFDLLEPRGFTVVSPMREKDMLVQGTVMGVDYSMYGEVPELRAQSIFTRDQFDVYNSDIILANFTDLGVAADGSPIPSLGSDFEMAWGFLLRKPLVLVAPADNYYRRHPFSISAASIMFDTLEPACDWIVRNFQPHIITHRIGG